MAFNSHTARIYGRKGGLKTKERLKDDPNYFSRIGFAGGSKVMKNRGKEFYSKIGSLPKTRKEAKGE